MKNLFKKIGALLVAAIMVLAMASTAFADGPTATITVNNAGKATLTYAQVIKADQTTRTGWTFVNDDVKDAYIKAYEVADNDAQAAIEALIANTDAEKLGKAQALAAGKVSFVKMSNPQTVHEAGVYLVKATEEGYTYNIMSAYVGFGEAPNLANTTVYAKKTPMQVNKQVLDTDNVTKTGDVLTYTVSTNVPYINPTDKDKSFWEANPYFYIYTPDGREIVYHIYSAATVKDTDDVYLTGFENDEAYQSYLDMTKRIAIYDTGVEVTTTDSVVTLSTCTSASDEHRFVVIGVKEQENQMGQTK